MSDERLRELERRWKETGNPGDEDTMLLELGRTGKLTGLYLCTLYEPLQVPNAVMKYTRLVGEKREQIGERIAQVFNHYPISNAHLFDVCTPDVIMLEFPPNEVMPLAGRIAAYAKRQGAAIDFIDANEKPPSLDMRLTGTRRDLAKIETDLQRVYRGKTPSSMFELYLVGSSAEMVPNMGCTLNSLVTVRFNLENMLV